MSSTGPWRLLSWIHRLNTASNMGYTQPKCTSDHGICPVEYPTKCPAGDSFRVGRHTIAYIYDVGEATSSKQVTCDVSFEVKVCLAKFFSLSL